MNRNSEYTELIKKLEDTPLKLDYTVSRARSRKSKYERRRRAKKAVFFPLGLLAAVFLIFTVLVNYSAPFADACSAIPVLDRLAEALKMSPSLSDALKNDYVQKIGLEQSKDGVSAKIEYVIVDQKELNIFYSLGSDKYSEMKGTCKITKPLSGYSVLSYHEPQIQDSSLRKIVVDFSNGFYMPDSVEMTLSVFDAEGSYEGSSAESPGALPEYEYSDPIRIADFDFALKFDPEHTASGELIIVDKPFKLDGQSLTLENVEIYPSHTRLYFSAAEGNSAWLKDLDFYLENGKGEIFDGRDGISSMGESESPMMSTYLIQSAYFYDTDQIKLCIRAATWLEKDKEQMQINMSTGTADDLPDGVKLEYVGEYSNGRKLYFSVPSTYNNRELLAWNFFDADGNYYNLGERYRTGGGVFYEEVGKVIGEKDAFVEQITIYKEGYSGDEIWIPLNYSKETKLSSPLEIRIK